MFEYLNDRLFQILFVIAQNVVNHVLLLNIQFVLMDTKVPKTKIFACAGWIVFFYLMPIYSLDFLSYYPILHFEVWTFSLLVFITPITAILYYFVIKNVLKFSPTKSSIVVRQQLLMHYIVVLVYMLFNDIFTKLLGSVEILKTFYLGDVLGIITIIALLLLVRLLLKIYLNRSRKYLIISPNYFEKNITWRIITMFLEISFIYVTIVLFRHYSLSDNYEPIALTTGLVYALVSIAIFLYLKNKISKLQIKLLDWEMQATGTYISSLLHANQEFRGVKHDFYNMLQIYGGYLTIGDYDALNRYHKSLFSTTKHAGDFLELIEVLRSRFSVYSLIESMAQKADENDVVFSFNLVCDITNVILTDLDLCRVLSIVFDNAIEAAALSEKKQVNISFERKGEKTVVIVVSNTTNEDVDVNCIFNDGYTSKEDHEGIGLPQIIHILNSYEHCTFRVNYHEKQFTIFLILSADISVKALQ